MPPGDSAHEATRWEFLARASAVLGSSLDYAETLRLLANLFVPSLADWCSVDVADGDGTIRRLAVAHADPSKREIVEQAATYPPDPTGRHPRTRVLTTGRSLLMPQVNDEDLAQGAGNPEHLRALRALAYRSAMIVPLLARGQILGAFTLATTGDGRRYGPDDLELAEEVALRAAIAIDNARLYGEAQDANRAKDEFLASVSHELRTPLQAMLGWVGVLRQGKYTPERLARALEIIERAGRAQARLIDDLLDVSRIATSRFRLELRTLDPLPVLQEAVDSVRPAAEAKRITLEATLDPGVGAVVADPLRLRQVAWNLLWNAVKFTPGGGRVQLRLERDGSEMRIVVKDDGQGIAPEFLPHVFEPFRQAASANRHGHAGLGLGLAIVRSVVELHGGRVAVRSEGVGRGTEFTVLLPVAAAAAATGAR